MQHLTQLKEEQLIHLIKQGNEQAIGILLERYKDKLFYAAYILVKDRYLAEDLFQEACIKVIRSIRKGNYSEEGKFLPWAARIIRNLGIDHIRKAKRHVKVTLPNGGDIFELLDIQEKTHEQKIMLNQSCKKVRELLADLPVEQREVIVMRLYGELSFKEIATLTNVSINTTLGRMRYGLLNLKKIVQDLQIVL